MVAPKFPFCVLGLVLVPIYVKLKTKKTSLRAKLARVDWIGSIFFTAGMTSFLVGISWAGIQYEWKSAQVIAPMTVGVSGVVATIVWEAYYAKEPILRPSLFYSTSAIFTYACALFQGLIVCHPRAPRSNEPKLTSTISSSAFCITFLSTSPPSTSSRLPKLGWTSSQ